MNTSLTALIADLNEASNDVLDVVKPVVKRGAVNIKRDWRSDARARNGSHAKAYPSSISFDIETAVLSSEVTAEIGPDKDKRQGALGNILEFGSPKSAPQLSGQRALDGEADEFEAQLAKAERRLTW